MQPVFDAEQFDAILDLLSEGVSLRSACERTGVARRTFRGWLERDPTLAERYDVARRMGIDCHVDAIIETADSVIGSDSAAAVSAVRLRIDSVRWLASKLLPGRYGDKIELTGANGSNLIPEGAADPQRASAAFVALLQTRALPLPPVAAIERQPEKLTDDRDD